MWSLLRFGCRTTIDGMSWRFRRRLRILPGITWNFSKSGVSTSFCVRGAHYTVGPRGRRFTVGIPGTGLSYTEFHRRRAQPRTKWVRSPEGHWYEVPAQRRKLDRVHRAVHRGCLAAAMAALAIR